MNTTMLKKLRELLDIIDDGHAHMLSCGYCPCCNGGCREGCDVDCGKVYKLTEELDEYLKEHFE